MAPRGVGTMISMILVGRLSSRVDARLLIFIGLALTAYSLFQMTGFSPEMGERPRSSSAASCRVWGSGSSSCRSRRSPSRRWSRELRTEALEPLLSWSRNIGSSVGISVVATLLARNIAVNRTELVSELTPYNPNLDQVLAGERPDHGDGRC